jgi:hypothetical protein
VVGCGNAEAGCAASDAAGCAVCEAAGDVEDGCEFAGCCAAALSDTRQQAVKINFQLRITLFSMFRKQDVSEKTLFVYFAKPSLTKTCISPTQNSPVRRSFNYAI